MVVRLEIRTLERVVGDLPQDATEEVAQIFKSLQDRTDPERTEGTAYIGSNRSCPWVQTEPGRDRYILAQPSADETLNMIALLTTTCGVSLEVEPEFDVVNLYLSIGKYARIDFTDKEELLFFLDQCGRLHTFLTEPPREGVDPA